MCGDFPVPPTVILPTEIDFVLNCLDLKIPKSNKRFLVFVAIPKRKAIGNKTSRKKNME